MRTDEKRAYAAAYYIAHREQKRANNAAYQRSGLGQLLRYRAALRRKIGEKQDKLKSLLEVLRGS